MWYSWKDVRDNMVVSFVGGVVFALITYGIAKAVYDPTMEMSFQFAARFCLVMGGTMFLIMFQVFAWDSGIKVWTHGWVLKTCDVVGSNIVFLTPFGVAMCLV